MKKLSILLLGLVLLPYALAACSGGNDELIFRISNTTNAHAELWNGSGGYGTEICYDAIFGSAYGPGGHGGNPVLDISAATNAHADTTGAAGYATAVQFGDLVCRASVDGVDAPCDGAVDEYCITRLSATTNAHVGTCAGAPTYPVKICCSSSAIIPPGTGRLQILSFTLIPNPVDLRTAATETVTATVIVKNRGSGAVDGTVGIIVKDMAGAVIPAVLTNVSANPQNIGPGARATFTVTFPVDQTWGSANYPVTATATRAGEPGPDHQAVSYLIVYGPLRQPVPELSLSLVVAIAFSVLAVAFLSKKGQF